MSTGSETICAKQINAPRIGTVGTQGVLNGRGISGCVFLKTMILIHTIANASKVPIDTNSPKILIGKMPAKIIATEQVIMVLTYGVLNFG